MRTLLYSGFALLVFCTAGPVAAKAPVPAKLVGLWKVHAIHAGDQIIYPEGKPSTMRIGANHTFELRIPTKRVQRGPLKVVGRLIVLWPKQGKRTQRLFYTLRGRKMTVVVVGRPQSKTVYTKLRTRRR